MMRIGMVAVAGLLAACSIGAPAPGPGGQGGQGGGQSGEGGTLRQRLEPGLTLDLMSERGAVACTVLTGDDARQGEVEIEGGAITLSLGAGSVLDVEAIDVVLGDFALEQHVEQPITLKDVSGTWAPTSPIETIWSGDARAYGSATGTLTVRWTLETRDGHQIELQDLELEDVALDLDATLDVDGRVTLAVAGQVPGSFFEWAGLVELADMTFELEGLSASVR